MLPSVTKMLTHLVVAVWLSLGRKRNTLTCCSGSENDFPNYEFQTLCSEEFHTTCPHTKTVRDCWVELVVSEGKTDTKKLFTQFFFSKGKKRRESRGKCHKYMLRRKACKSEKWKHMMCRVGSARWWNRTRYRKFAVDNIFHCRVLQ